MVVASDTVRLLAIASMALIVMVGLAWFGTVSQGVCVVVLVLFAGFVVYGYVLMKEGDYDELE